MRIRLRKLYAIVATTTALTLGTSCSEKPHLPPVSPHPTEKIVLKIHTDMVSRPDPRKSKPTYIEVLYTPTDPGCGYVDYWLEGGIYRRPEKRVIFTAQGGIATIYKDYFKKRKKCPARISQATIHIAGPNGLPSYINVNALVIDDHTPKVLHAICDFEPAFQYHICVKENEIGSYKLVENDRFIIDVRRLDTR